MIVDAEAVTTGYLKTQLPAVRLSGGTPTDRSTSWVRLWQLDARDEAAGIDYLTSSMLQLDCYAGQTGGQEEASLLARKVREALVAMPQRPTQAVVAQVRITGHQRMPDDAFEPARERYVLTVEVTAHP